MAIKRSTRAKVARDPETGRFISVRELRRRKVRKFMRSITPKWLWRKKDGN